GGSMDAPLGRRAAGLPDSEELALPIPVERRNRSPRPASGQWIGRPSQRCSAEQRDRPTSHRGTAARPAAGDPREARGDVAGAAEATAESFRATRSTFLVALSWEGFALTRIRPLLVVPALLLAFHPSWARQPDFHLQVVPAIVYKVDDPGNINTSSFVFDIAAICSTECALTPVAATVELSNGRSTVERQEWTSERLAKIKGLNYRILPDTPVASPRRLFTLPEAFDLHFYLRCPQALAIDSADVRVTVVDGKGRRAQQALKIPI